MDVGTVAILRLCGFDIYCFAYSVGLLGVLQWVLGFTALSERSDWAGQLAASLSKLDIPGLLILVAIMHLAEALLIRWQGARFASPLFLEGKRGSWLADLCFRGIGRYLC